MAEMLREQSDRVGLSRVSKRMDMHRHRSQREASGVSRSSTLSRESSTPHYCAALLSQTPSHIDDDDYYSPAERVESDVPFNHPMDTMDISDKLAQEPPHDPTVSNYSSCDPDDVPDCPTYNPGNPVPIREVEHPDDFDDGYEAAVAAESQPMEA